MTDHHKDQFDKLVGPLRDQADKLVSEKAQVLHVLSQLQKGKITPKAALQKVGLKASDADKALEFEVKDSMHTMTPAERAAASKGVLEVSHTAKTLTENTQKMAAAAHIKGVLEEIKQRQADKLDELVKHTKAHAAIVSNGPVQPQLYTSEIARLTGQNK